MDKELHREANEAAGLIECMLDKNYVTAKELWKLIKWAFILGAKYQKDKIALDGLCKIQNNMVPKIGLIVNYVPSEQDKAKMRAADTLNNGCNEMDKLPAIITAVWSETCVNLRVICDGNLDLWKTSAAYGETDNCWNFVQ